MAVVVELVHPTPESSREEQAETLVETLAHLLAGVRFNLRLPVELVRHLGAPVVYLREELNQHKVERAEVEVDLELLAMLHLQALTEMLALKIQEAVVRQPYLKLLQELLQLLPQIIPSRLLQGAS